MQKAFFILGPTAVGKTDVAVELAARCGAEIISADAFQIYRGFDLLTAKPTAEQRRRVAHHLVGHVEASESYNVARYLADARIIYEQLTRAGRPVIVAGGNGLYVKALTHGLSSLPEARPELRAELEQTPLDELLARLGHLDPAAAAVIDAQNPRRVVRALEVCLLTGKPFSSFQTKWENSVNEAFPRGVFLTCDRGDLVTKINRRVEAMFAAGVVEEVRSTDTSALSPTARQILGLTEIQDHLLGRIDFQTCKEQIKIATRQYARRQVTWFKREKCFETVSLENIRNETALVQRIRDKFARLNASSAV